MTEGGRRGRGAVVESAYENDEPVSEESTCSNEGSLSEPPPLPRGVQGGGSRPLRLGGQMCVQARRRLPAAGGGGRAPKRDEKLVTLEATTTPDGGDSSAEEAARGRALEPPAPEPRWAPAGDEAISASSASDG